YSPIGPNSGEPRRPRHDEIHRAPRSRCRCAGPLLRLAPRMHDLTQPQAGNAGGSRVGELRRHSMDIFVQQLINGITLGSIYGLIAIGYTMVFGIIGMVNFAHGDVFMVSAFIGLVTLLIVTAWLGIASVALALLIVLVVSMVLTSLVNWTIERVAYRPLRGSFRLARRFGGTGLSILLSNFVGGARGPRKKSTPPLVPGELVLMDTDGYQVTLSYKQMIVWAVTAVLLL